MRKVFYIFIVLGMLMMASCGTELPDSLNYTVKKGGGYLSDPTPTPVVEKKIPAEADNPLPTF